MGFTIQSDFLLPKAGDAASRKGRAAETGEPADAFARTLMQTLGLSGQDEAAGSGDKAADADTSSRNIFLFHPESETEPELSAPPAEGDIALLTENADIAGEPEIVTDADDLSAESDLTAQAMEAAETTDTADDADPTDSTDAVIPVPVPETDTAETAAAAPETVAATGTATPAKGQNETKNDTKAASAEAAAASAPPPEVQAMAVNAVAQPDRQASDGKTPVTAKTEAAASLPIAGKTTADAQQATQAAAPPTSGKAEAKQDTAFPHPDTDNEFETELAKTDTTTDSGKAKVASGPSPATDPAMIGAAQSSQQTPAAQPAQAAAANQMTPTHALLTASPAETVRIITDRIGAADDGPDRVTVQLDPPELGRVSIDFKFDSHGLQHVTITGDNPEALKQLRLMHFELTQALERNGLSSQNMTFQQQQSGQQQTPSGAAPRSFNASAPADASSSTQSTPAPLPARPARAAGGGIDLRL